MLEDSYVERRLHMRGLRDPSLNIALMRSSQNGVSSPSCVEDARLFPGGEDWALLLAQLRVRARAHIKRLVS